MLYHHYILLITYTTTPVQGKRSFECQPQSKTKIILNPGSNFEKPGGPNSTTNNKIFLSNFEYNLVNKHVEYSDQHVGARHTIWCDKDFKFMKICTIVLMIIMVLALKVLALSTLSVGALIFERVILIYGWMPAHGALVIWALIGAFILYKSLTKTKRLYYKMIKQRVAGL